MQRREFLKLTAATSLSLLPIERLFASPQLANQKQSSLLSCRSDDQGNHFLTAISPQGEIQFNVRLPGRGHGMCIKADGTECVVFARRPDDFMWVVNFNTGQVIQQKTSPEGRHYYGHGVFDPDGNLLYATENDYEQGRGVIAIYDATDNYRRVGELSSYGIGPHELKLMPDGDTLVVANGGILTHPDTGRSKLNLGEMDPSLVYVNRNTGKLLGQYRPPAQWHQLSIRHLDVNTDGKVCVVMQYQGSNKQTPPLVALHQGEDSLQLLSAPAEIQKQMRNYCGSVSCDASGQVAAVSSPRGNLLTLWNMQDGALLHTLEYSDGCGLAKARENNTFYATNGHGRMARLQPGQKPALETRLEERGWHWDNHILAFI